MPAGYTALSTENDQERELNDAFDSEDEDSHTQETALLSSESQRSEPAATASAGQAYDFEREYDWMAPPPGSPAPPTSEAVPNTIGNSNGLIPDEPVAIPSHPRPSLLRRAMGAFMPTGYARVPSGPSSSTVGRGNDGVFANIMGKPQPARTVRNENGEVHVVPETVGKDVPPTYTEAQADSVPPYWETTVHAPAASMASGEMLVDDLPTGSFLAYLVTFGISFFFQIVGFLLTYLLHTSHAGKYGALGGLGMTLIQFGFVTKARENDPDAFEQTPWWSGHGGSILAPDNTTATQASSVLIGREEEDAMAAVPTDDAYVVTTIATKDWLAFFVMTIGWFFLLTSIIGFLRVKRWERRLRDSNSPAPAPRSLSRADMNHDREIRRNLESVFGLSIEDDGVRVDEHGRVIVIPDQQRLEEERLTNDLRAAGLL